MNRTTPWLQSSISCQEIRGGRREIFGVVRRLRCCLSVVCGFLKIIQDFCDSVLKAEDSPE